MWTGLQADFDLRHARYKKQKQIERHGTARRPGTGDGVMVVGGKHRAGEMDYRTVAHGNLDARRQGLRQTKLTNKPPNQNGLPRLLCNKRL